MSSFFSNVLSGDSKFSRYMLQPILNFGARFYLAYVFFKAGLSKIDDGFMVKAEIIKSFKDDFKVPYLPPEIAANLAAYAELALPILLVLGLFTRPAAFALFILNAVALYSLHVAGWANPVANWLHIFWGVLMLFIIAYGPSKFAIDSWLSDRLRDRESSLTLKIVAIVILSAVGYFLLNKYL